MDGPMTILPDLSDLIIEQVSVTDGVTVTVHAASPPALCPCCGTDSKRVHSYYTRSSMPRAGAPPGMKEDILERDRGQSENGRPVMNMSVSPKLSPGTRLHRQLS